MTVIGTIPRRFADLLAPTEDQRWVEAASLLEALGGEAGLHAYQHITAASGGVNDEEFWRWVDIVAKMEDLRTQVLH